MSEQTDVEKAAILWTRKDDLYEKRLRAKIDSASYFVDYYKRDATNTRSSLKRMHWHASIIAELEAKLKEFLDGEK
jgi:hypothetical protein